MKTLQTVGDEIINIIKKNGSILNMGSHIKVMIRKGSNCIQLFENYITENKNYLKKRACPTDNHTLDNIYYIKLKPVPINFQNNNNIMNQTIRRNTWWPPSCFTTSFIILLTFVFIGFYFTL
jgi:hypothetical protein